jgi:hypothetical protein
MDIEVWLDPHSGRKLVGTWYGNYLLMDLTGTRFYSTAPPTPLWPNDYADDTPAWYKALWT